MFGASNDIDDMFGLLELNNKYKSKSLFDNRNTILNCEITRNIIRNLSLNNSADGNLDINHSASSLEKENEQQIITSHSEPTTKLMNINPNSVLVNSNDHETDNEEDPAQDINQDMNPLDASNHSSAKASFSFGFCKVCRDKATGIHYGIPSCEGCKVITYLITVKTLLNVSGTLSASSFSVDNITFKDLC